MGNCIQRQLTKEEQQLRNLIEYVANLDISTDMVDKSRINYEYRNKALELFKFSIGELKKYINTEPINPKIVIEKTLYVVNTYKYFMNTLNYPVKQFFQPIKGAILEMLQTIEEYYDKPTNYKIKKIVYEVIIIDITYTKSMVEYYTWLNI